MMMMIAVAAKQHRIFSIPGTNDSITLEDLVDDFAAFYVGGEYVHGWCFRYMYEILSTICSGRV